MSNTYCKTDIYLYPENYFTYSLMTVFFKVLYIYKNREV